MTIHLHWLYLQGPRMLQGLTTGGTLCGLKNIRRKELTSFEADADCEECLRRAKAKANERPPRPTLTPKARRRYNE